MKISYLRLLFIPILFMLSLNKAQAQIEQYWTSPKILQPIQENDSSKILYGGFTRTLKLEKKYLQKLPELWKDAIYFSVHYTALDSIKTGKAHFKAILKSALNAPNLSSLSIFMPSKQEEDSYTFHSYSDSAIKENFWKPLSQFKQLEKLRIFNPDTSQAFIHYLAQFPNLKVLYWSGPHNGLDFSPLAHLEALILGSPYNSYMSIEQSIKDKLVLPTQLDALILHNNSLSDILPILANFKGKLSYLKTNRVQRDKIHDLSLLKGKVTQLDWWVSNWNIDLPLGDSALQSLTVTGSVLTKHLYIGENIRTYKNLETLHLENYFTTTLSPSFYQLPKLKHLTINTNYLSDSIQYLKTLETLNLDSETLKQVPSTLGKLENLKALDITANKLTSFPVTFRNLKQLEAFKISAPNLKRLPKGLKHLKQLKEIDIFAGKVHQMPSEIGRLRQLKSLSFYGSETQVLFPIFRTVPSHTLKKLQQLEEFSLSINFIVTRAQLKNIYRILPETTKIYIYSLEDKYQVQTLFNLGIYTQYDIGGTVSSGLEFNYHYIPHWSLPNYSNNAIKKPKKDYNIFDFHTFNAGIEWNYLKSFVMGYKTGYTYTHKRLNLALQADFIAYTDYKNKVDLRINPKIGIYIPSTFAAFYVMYGYKIPLIPNQELNLVPRHNISLTMRITTQWPNSFGAPVLIW